MSGSGTGTPAGATTTIISLADAKAALSITDTTDDTLLTRLITECSALFAEHWPLPTVPAVTETRTLHTTGRTVFLPWASAVTAVTDLDEVAIDFDTVPGERSTDPIRWLHIHTREGYVHVTGTFGLAAYPAYVTAAAIETVKVWYKRAQVGGPGSENSYVGRVEAIPKAALDFMAPLQIVRV